MKLLLDQNLSHKLVAAVSDLYPASAHVRELGLERADDLTIWHRAERDGYCIVSKDDDFLQRSTLQGAPPKIIWLRVGNCPTSRIVAVLRSHLVEIVEFGNDPELSFLILS